MELDKLYSVSDAAGNDLDFGLSLSLKAFLQLLLGARLSESTAHKTLVVTTAKFISMIARLTTLCRRCRIIRL
jgi:hypothetical protein